MKYTTHLGLIPSSLGMTDDNQQRDRLRSWLWLLPASLTEVAWISGVKSSSNPLEWGATTAAVILSVWLALRATRYMAATTVYIVFVALGTMGVFVVNITVYSASFSVTQVALLAALLVGVIGLKATSPA